MTSRYSHPARIYGTHGSMTDLILNPTLWRWLLFAGQPIRLAIAANVFVGRSLRSIFYDLLHRLTELIGWLSSPLSLSSRFASHFEKQYFRLRNWHVAAAALVLARLARYAARSWRDRTSGLRERKLQLRRQLLDAQDYREWRDTALQLQELTGVDLRSISGATLYDRKLIDQRRAHLQYIREHGDVNEMMFSVRMDLLRNLGNITNAALHEQHIDVPEPIRLYIEEVRSCLKLVAASPVIPAEERLSFLRETRHAFGRTALVLSGGGSFGSFHLGVVKALLDANLLPRVLSGSSAGAIVAALICTRTDQELVELFAELPERLQGIDFYSSNTAGQILKHLVLKGTLQDHNVLQERLQRLLGDMTFQEAYSRSGRILNVAVTAADTTEPPRLLNYLTAPNAIIWSAVACSSAFPFLFAPQTLLARDARGYIVPFAADAASAAGEAQRRWRDGSLEEDLPMRGLSELFNVNYFLVSQCNPYLLPIIATKLAAPRVIGNLLEQEFKHRCKQLMELLPRRFGASKVLKLLSQPWEGDVTIVLPVSTLSALKAVINLSREDLLLALAEGQRATWAKISAIAANCSVEVTLDELLRQVTALARRKRIRLQRRASTVALLGSTNSLAALHATAAASGPPGGGGGGTTDGVSPRYHHRKTSSGGGGSGIPNAVRSNNTTAAIYTNSDATNNSTVPGGMRRGIPSWLHLHSLGIPHSGSQDTLYAANSAAALPMGSGSFFRSEEVDAAAALGQRDLTDTIVLEENDAEILDAVVEDDGEVSLVEEHHLEEEEEEGTGTALILGKSEMPAGAMGVDAIGAAVSDRRSAIELGGIIGNGNIPGSSSSHHSMANLVKWDRPWTIAEGDDVWRDLFQIAPATRGGVGAGGGEDGLDFIAP